VCVFFQQDVVLGDDEINFGTESEANIVLDNEGSAGCPQRHTKCSDVIGCSNEYESVPRSRGADGGWE
jgi:hypothetical protein